MSFNREEKIKNKTYHEYRLTPAEFSNEWEVWVGAKNVDITDTTVDNWIGGSSFDCNQYIKTGDNKNVTKMLKLSDSIIANHLQNKISKNSEVIKSNYGGCVNIPAAIVNHPRAFYRRKLVSKPGLRVFIGISFSAAFKASKVHKNILAYIALVKYLCNFYNVELKIMFPVAHNNFYSTITMPIGLSPFDWSQIMGLTHTTTARKFVWNWHNEHVDHRLGYGCGSPITDLKDSMGDFLHIKPGDIVLNGMLLGESTPETWVNEQIKKLENETRT